MKLAIITLPLHINYGGLLQAFALQKVLENKGHSAYVIDYPYRETLVGVIIEALKNIIKKYVLRRKDISSIIPQKPNKRVFEIISQNTRPFIKENIKTTEKLSKIENIHQVLDYDFEAYIVGSDQVWRPKYSPGIYAKYLDFLPDESTVKRISYAASFGVDKWEYSKKMTRRCKELAQKFDAVSVREDSGIEHCKKHFSIDAKLVLDPTLLLSKKDYIELIEKDQIPEKKNSLMVYVLDKNEDNKKIVNNISNSLGLKTNSVMPEQSYSRGVKNIEDCVYPKVTEWLRGFSDAKFVVTDSFHGTLFSIIFNKPFITIGNQERGLSRFLSVLNLFDLKERLICGLDDYNEKMVLKPIDYDKINKIVDKYRAECMNFLHNALDFDI